MKIRASETPRFLQCSRYKAEPIQIDEANEAAAVGTAVHTAMELIARGESPKKAYTRAIRGLAVESERLGEMWAMVQTGAEQLETFTGELDGWTVIAEKSMATAFPAGIEKLTGTPDLILISPDWKRVVIIDWKTSRDTSDLDVIYHAQLLSYALLWASESPKTVEYQLVVSGLRDNVYYSTRAEREELREHATSLMRAATDEAYRTGEHCRYCRAQYTCPAILAKTQAAVRTLENDAYTVADLIRTGRFGEIWELRKNIERRLDEFKEAARQHIAANGPISLGGGKALTLTTTRTKTIAPNEALNLLRTVEDDPLRIAACFKPVTSAIEAVVKERAREAGRPLGKAIEAFYEALEKNGGLRYHSSPKLTTIKEK